jgi:hypothetical protein
MREKIFVAWEDSARFPGRLPIKVVLASDYEALAKKVARIEALADALDGKRYLVDGNDMFIVEQLKEALSDTDLPSWDGSRLS